MNWMHVPWLEGAVFVALLGSIIVSRVREPLHAARLCLVCTSLSLIFTTLAYVVFSWEPNYVPHGLSIALLGRSMWQVDELNAPLIPMVALLHVLTTLGTAHTKMVRFSFARLLVGNALRLALFASIAPNDVCLWLILATLPPYMELRARQQPTGVYLIHMVLFIGLLFGGLATMGHLSACLFLAAVLVRSGTFPTHVWIVDLTEKASFGTALLTIVPVTGLLAALRLIHIPDAPPWLFTAVGVISLGTALYSAALGVIQTDVRRFFAYFAISQSALVFVGMELHSALSLTGSLTLWLSAALSLLGFGLTLRALEARFGRLSLYQFRGYYTTAPLLAMSFLLTGLATIGFPGTSGFLAMELLVDGAVSVNPAVGITVIIVTAANGVALLRAYFLIFTGHTHRTTIPMTATWRERLALLVVVGILVLLGFMPNMLVTQRHAAAQQIIGTQHE